MARSSSRNVGGSVFYFALEHPDARIVGFEPDPLSFAKLELNTRAFGNVTVLPLALSDSDGEATLFRSPDSVSSSLTRRATSNQMVRVRARSLDTVVRDLSLDHVDLLKVDIEGAELDVLAGSRKLDRVDAIVGEFHGDILGRRPEELFSHLTGFAVEVKGDPGSPRCKFFATRRDPGAGTRQPTPRRREAGSWSARA